MDWLILFNKSTALALLVILVYLFFLCRYVGRQDLKNSGWSPTAFTYPAFNSLASELPEMTPLPYRPFKWKYHMTMGIRPLEWENWIEIDNQLPRYHRIKRHRIHSRGEDAVRVMPDNWPSVGSGYQGAVELVHELADFLQKRYPSVYQVTRAHDSSISTITVTPLNVVYDLPAPLTFLYRHRIKIRTPSKEDAEQAMRISALITQDDFAVMVEGTDRRYYFQAGSICIPGSWRISDKIGMPLEEIHISGGVPQYRQKLHVGMSRFFCRLAVDRPVVRNNYSIQVVPPLEAQNSDDPEELAWSMTIHGPEVAFGDTIRAHPPISPIVTPENLRLRSERQTLRRLPLSGVIVFGIRTYVTKVEALATEDGVAARLASAVRSWPEEVQDYKGKKVFGDVLLGYLDSMTTHPVLEESRFKTDYPF